MTKGAGLKAGFTDGAYTSAGATIVDNVWPVADVVVKVNAPTQGEVEALNKRVVVSLLKPNENKALVDKIAAQGGSALALDMLLRTLSRGQAFDVLSSQVCW